MTIWILALVLLASLAGLGYRQGVVRVAFSLIGIFISALLAGPLSGPVRALLPRLGIHNQIEVWLLSPFIVFVILLSVFKSAGFFVSRKVEVHFKYHAGDLQLLLWNRLNHRLGLCLGFVNGLVYLILISFVIYDFSYWTAQVATSDDEARSVRLLNQMGRDLESTGMAKVARAIDPMPEMYFKAADLAGLLYQNPQLADRLANYPMFTSLGERDDFKQLGSDADFQSAWKNHSPIGQLLNNANALAIWRNNDTANLIWGMVQTDYDDLNGYLKTGQSEKYGSEKILGRWVKEFRYLRTVIVTAAVYRGFDFRACTPPLNLPAPGRRQTLYVAVLASQSPVFLVNSRHPLVCAPSPWLPRERALFSRSYEGNLPSSFSTILSSALVCSTSPPVSV